MIMKSFIKELLNESLNTKNKYNPYIDEFVKFAINYFNIKSKLTIKLCYRKENISTTAHYDLNGIICVYVKNRALVDILRSLGHEITHHHQMETGNITDVVSNGSDGSDIENQANAEAGVLIRKFGKLHTQIYTL